MADVKMKRPKFNSRNAFIFAMLGSVVGLGNIWRFPSVLYSNGGASFIVAYLLILFTVGISHLFLEYAMGFNFKASVASIFTKVNRKYEFLGWFLPFNIFLVLTYYVAIIAISFIYFILSFGNHWGNNTNAFFSGLVLNSFTPSTAGFFKLSIPIFIALAVIWFFIWYCSRKDVNKGLARICNIMMPLMFFMMILIVIIALTLPGSYMGIANLFAPRWDALLNPTLWIVVLAQIAFSMGLGDSTAISFTSYLDENSHNLMDNALIVTTINFLFGLVASIAVFSILGHMSVSQGVPFSSVVSSGTSLVFVAFPDIFNSLGSFAIIIAPLFFLCFIFAGFTSAIALFEPMAISISEKFAFSRKKAASIIVILGFLISILYATGSGMYMLNLADSFLNEITLSVILLIEVGVFAWIYGIDKLKLILNKYSSFNVGKGWMIIAKYIMPAVIIFLLVNSLYKLYINNTIFDWISQIFYVSLLIIVPTILTKLPGKTKEFYD